MTVRLTSVVTVSLANQAVVDMKCYVNYYHKGTFRDQLVYKEA